VHQVAGFVGQASLEADLGDDVRTHGLACEKVVEGNGIVVEDSGCNEVEGMGNLAFVPLLAN